jgi:hypothetical protein
MAGVVALTSFSCIKTPLLAPSGSAITFTAPAEAFATDTVTITVDVREAGSGTVGQDGQTKPTVGGGTPVHNGTLVTFSTTMGTLSPAEARTVGGKATIELIGDGNVGKATITASSGPATKTHEITFKDPGAQAAR